MPIASPAATTVPPVARALVSSTSLTSTVAPASASCPASFAPTEPAPWTSTVRPASSSLPCALGATLSEESIPRLRCGIVAGAANNQLATPEDGERLRAAGILYAPDFVINAGGAMHGIGQEQLGWDADELERRVAGIGDTLTRIFETAETDGITTDEAAERLAAEALATTTSSR